MINPVQKTGRMGPGMAYQNNAPTNKQVKRPLQWTEAPVTLYINILPFTQSYICSLKPHSKKPPSIELEDRWKVVVPDTGRKSER